MIGAALLLFALLVAIPMMFMAIATAVSMIASWSHTADAEASHEGSELIDLNT